jgi:hypothetical protein
MDKVHYLVNVAIKGTKIEHLQILMVNFRLIRQLVLRIGYFFIGFEPKTVKFSVVDGATKI